MTRNPTSRARLLLVLVLTAVGPAAPAEHLHIIRSPHQRGQTTVRVFTPAGGATPMKTLYVLPVEAGSETRWGDPAAEIRRLGLADRHGLLVALPTFSELPWYADHPSEPSLRQERYLLEEVIPLIDATYPVQTGPGRRWLAGFSKSGWGAWSLLLRHPDVFDQAAAWDAPLMQNAPDRFGMGPIFGTLENFERYKVSDLVRARAGLLRARCRLVLTGYAGAFRQHHVAMHELLAKLEIPHVYRDGPQRAHHWQSGWLAEAVELLTVGCGTGETDSTQR